VRNRVFSDLEKRRAKLHLLRGLGKILLDIDKAIAIIRETEEERDVVPNLMIGFGIDELQADYIAEIKLRNINKEYILKRTAETRALEEEIADLKDILAKPDRVRDIIIAELEYDEKKYGYSRRTEIIYDAADDLPPEEEIVEDYPIHVFLSRGGYFKKITPLSLRMNAEQKYKEDDGPRLAFPSSNRSDLLVFTDRQQVYKARLRDFEDAKASALGTFLPSFLQMDDGESAVCVLDPGDYSGSVMFFFENGKAARVSLASYATKTNRKKLTGAYSDKSPLVEVVRLAEEREIALFSSDGRALVFPTSFLAPKPTRNTQGIQAITLRRNTKLSSVKFLEDTSISNRSRYLARSLPAAGAKLDNADAEQKQLELEL
jgi:DNA gyrase subunit A